MIDLVVCIPTFNRAKYLKENLDFLMPQVRDKKNVEVIIIDNASTDNTKEVASYFSERYGNVKYFLNNENLGYSGNQVKCIEYSNGLYTAILSDDDVYTDNLVDDILNITNEREYSFIALNYYSFIKDVDKPNQTNFAPSKDVIFDRGYDIMNYPSVGHFSGFVFNSNLAKKTLNQRLQKNSYEEYEKYRGIISDIAHRSLSKTSIPSFFFGKRKLAVRVPEKIDYDIINHQCLDYYEYFLGLFDEGLINKNDLRYRTRIVLNLLPRAIFRDVPDMNEDDIKNLYEKFKKYFMIKPKFLFISLPLLFLARFRFVKAIYSSIYKLKHLLIG